MTEREWYLNSIRAVRNARRAYRKADSSGERLERWLDRMIARKTRIRPHQARAVDPLWVAYRDAMRGLETALTDMLTLIGTWG